MCDHCNVLPGLKMSGDLQTEEVTHLKEKMGRECRVMKDVGEFTHVVDIRPSNMNLSIKFQLSGMYKILNMIT